jgi:NADPH:quinone reductase-like Zn-dependent oxidoreductase
MRAYAIKGFGTVGTVQDHPIGEPAAGEVLVAVRAAGVNVMDPIYVGGWMKDYQEHRFPFVPGIDLSGVVERLGPGVDRFAIGDEVYGVVARPFVGEGTYAELAITGADSLAPKPASISHEEAASVPHAGLTALAVIDAAELEADQVVAVVGATGGVGSFVTQLAALRGATVVAVASPEGTAQALEYGAASTVDYTEGDVAVKLLAAYPGGIDTLIDLHSDGDAIERFASALHAGGLVVSPRGPAASAAPALEARGLRFAPANRAPASRLPELTELIEAGKLRVPPIKVYPLDQAAAALAEMAAGHVRGKLVIEIA